MAMHPYASRPRRRPIRERWSVHHGSSRPDTFSTRLLVARKTQVYRLASYDRHQGLLLPVNAMKHCRQAAAGIQILRRFENPNQDPPHPITASPLPSPLGREKRGRGDKVSGYFHGFRASANGRAWWIALRVAGVGAALVATRG